MNCWRWNYFSFYGHNRILFFPWCRITRRWWRCPNTWSMWILWSTQSSTASSTRTFDAPSGSLSPASSHGRWEEIIIPIFNHLTTISVRKLLLYMKKLIKYLDWTQMSLKLGYIQSFSASSTIPTWQTAAFHFFFGSPLCSWPAAMVSPDTCGLSNRLARSRASPGSAGELDVKGRED